jgi:PAS domain S-box-containing protein
MLSEKGFSVVTEHSGEAAVARATGDQQIDLVLMDIDLGSGIDGTEAARRILAERELPIIFLTGHSEKEMVEKAKTITNYGYVLKNAGEFVLTESINMAFRLFDAHQRTREERENLRVTLYSIAEAVIVTDTRARITRLNRAAASLTGWSAGEAEGRELDTVLHTVRREEGDTIRFPVERVLQQGEEVKLPEDTVLVSKNGEHRQIDDTAAPIRSRSGRILGMIIVFRDVTRANRRERALEESELRYRSLFNSIRDAILVTDTQRRIIDCNRAFSELFGYSLKQLSDGSIDMLYSYSGELRKLDEHILWESGGPPTVTTVEFRRKNGDRFPGETTVFQLKDAEGTVTGFILMIRDVSRKQRVEEELQESNRFLSTLLNNLPGMAYRCRNDRNYTMDFVSKGARALTGYGPASLLHNRQVAYGELVVKEDQEYVWNGVQEALAEQKPFTIIYRIRRRDGAVRWVWEQGVGIYSPEGDFEGLQGFITDVSEQKEAQAEQQRLLKEQEVLLKEVHHRTKNDMNTIRSLLSLQAAASDFAREKRALEEAQRRISLMSRIYESLYTGRSFKRLSLRAFLPDLIQDIAASHRETPDIRLESEIEEAEVPARLSFPVGIIVNELLTNSYTHAFSGAAQGLVRVNVAFREQTALEIRVEDDGSGPPEELTEGKGFGFGLSIVDTLCGQYGGSLQFREEHGTLACVRLTVP